MQTAKTAIVTICLLTILYGAYVAINAPPLQTPEQLSALMESEGFDMNIDDGSMVPEISTDFGELQMPAGGGVNISLSDSPPADGNDPTGLPSLNFGDATQPAGPGASPTAGEPALPPLPQSFPGSNAVSASLSDSPSSSDDLSGILTAALPKPSSSAQPVVPDLAQDYPETPLAGLSLTAPGVLTPPSKSQTPTNDGPIPGLNDQTNIAPPQPAPVDEAPSASSSAGFENAITTADRQVAAGELREALFTLSLFYGSPDLSQEQLAQLMPRLNSLAGEVIYSRRHLVESAHRVQSGETLQTIAAARKVPAKLLANVNGIAESAPLTPGTELKVVSGPFRAEVNVTKSEMAVFLNDLYAGSFKVQTGTSPAPSEGTFAVQAKQEARAYYGLDGTTFPAGDPRNPYGEVWIDLGNRLAIHGSPQSESGSAQGCIQLKTADARDIFGILSQGSSVTIRR